MVVSFREELGPSFVPNLETRVILYPFLIARLAVPIAVNLINSQVMKGQL